MKTIVTGGSGYLGTYVRQFFEASDFSRRSSLNILEDADAQIVENYDVVIHLAGHLDKTPEGAEECFRTNADGTRNIIRHMRPGSVFIYASTKDVYGAEANSYEFVAEDCPIDPNPASAFELSKLIGERYVESVKHRWPIRLPAGVDPVRDIMYVDDLSRACRAFINSDREFGLYNLGGGRLNAISVRDIIGRVGKMLDIEPVIEDDPNIPAPLQTRYVTDTTLIQKELKWRLQIGIDDGLRVTF